MSYLFTHISNIISGYSGLTPLAVFLKTYYRAHPILGSRDRRIISEAVYCFYRASKGFDDAIALNEKMQACLFICETTESQIGRIMPEWFSEKPEVYSERKVFLEAKKYPFHLQKLLPASFPFSGGIQEEAWLENMLRQPKLFIRIRKKRKEIEALLQEKNILFEAIGDDCLALPNASSIHSFLPGDAYVVQDLSSQQTANYFSLNARKWWDCCCGAGGKSLLLKDKFPDAELTVSDSRKSIVHNLKERFKQYHIPPPEAHVVDATEVQLLQQKFGGKRFDAIICDVPCSGSGTWARTPESLYFFKEEILDSYALRQQKIAENALQFLKSGGELIYITCSVFRKENEAVVEAIAATQNVQIQTQQLINGISRLADSMFVAVLKKQ